MQARVTSRDQAFDVEFQSLTWFAVDFESDEPLVVFVVDIPKTFAIGGWDRETVDLISRIESEAAFGDRGRQLVDRLAAIKEKHEPMAGAFVGFFRRHAEKM